MEEGKRLVDFVCLCVLVEYIVYGMCISVVLDLADARALQCVEPCLRALSDFTNKTLKRQLANEKFRRLLIFTNFAQGHRARTIAMRPFLFVSLGATTGRCIFSCRFGRQLFTRRLATGRFARRLFGSCHLDLVTARETPRTPKPKASRNTCECKEMEIFLYNIRYKMRTQTRM